MLHRTRCIIIQENANCVKYNSSKSIVWTDAFNSLNYVINISSDKHFRIINLKFLLLIIHARTSEIHDLNLLIEADEFFKKCKVVCHLQFYDDVWSPHIVEPIGTRCKIGRVPEHFLVELYILTLSFQIQSLLSELK